MGSRVGGDGLAVWGAGLHLLNLRAGGQIELEIAIVHLRFGGRGCVADDEEAHPLHGSAVGLEANDVGGHAEIGDFGRHVIDVHIGRVDAGRRHLMIGNSLMNGADEVRPGHGDFEAEFSVAVDLGAAGHVHAVGEVDENDFIADGRLVGGAVGDRAGEGLGGG